MREERKRRGGGPGGAESPPSTVRPTKRGERKKHSGEHGHTGRGGGLDTHGVSQGGGGGPRAQRSFRCGERRAQTKGGDRHTGIFPGGDDRHIAIYGRSDVDSNVIFFRYQYF